LVVFLVLFKHLKNPIEV